MPARVSFRVRDLENHKFLGLVEHSHTPLVCAACGEDLADVMVVDPGSDVTLTYQATCHACGGRSPAVTIRGGTYIGSTASSRYADIVSDGDVQLIKTEKV